MKRTIYFFLMVMMMGMPGCTMQQIDNWNPSGLEVMFEQEPLIFDPSVVYMGTVVGQVLSREMGNGVTRILIALDDQYDELKKNNLAAVVTNGRLYLKRLSGYGDPLPSGGCINGFENLISYRLFKFRNLINNVNLAADRRAQRLLARSGLDG